MSKTSADSTSGTSYPNVYNKVRTDSRVKDVKKISRHNFRDFIPSFPSVNNKVRTGSDSKISKTSPDSTSETSYPSVYNKVSTGSRV